MINTQDPLLESLQFICRYYGKQLSKEALVTGLPLDKQLTPSLFIRAVERIGFQAKIVKRQLGEISKLVLPATLLLKDNKACILLALEDNKANLFIPEQSDKPIQQTIQSLENNYSGYAILVQPAPVVINVDSEPKKRDQKAKWFWAILWHYRSVYLQILIASFLVNLFMLAAPLFVMAVYDRVIPNTATITLWVLTSAVLFILLVDFILRILRSYLVDVIGKKVDIIVASKLFQSILGMQYAHKPNSSGELISTVREFETVREFITSGFLTSLIDIPFVFLYILVVAYLSPLLGLATTIVIALLFVTNWLSGGPLHKAMQKNIVGGAKKNALLMEVISGLETIKGTAIEGVMQKRWESRVDEASKVAMRSRLIAALTATIAISAQQIILVVITVLGVYLVFANQLTLGALIACNILGVRAVSLVSRAATLLSQYHRAKVALKDLTKVITLPSEVSSKEYLNTQLTSIKIQLQGISFTYPKKISPVLKHLNLQINPGERIAIMGRLGSGKSTLLKILVGLYNPTEGSFLMNDIDHSQFNPADLRHHIIYVPQDTVLFAGTIKENILFSNPTASDDDLLRVSAMTGVDSFANQHPLGYGMTIGERGEGLSGGQRQAIGLARALLMEPQILLLDEPTSAMDIYSEKLVISNLQKYLNQNKTLIIATHRLSVLNLVDRIVILHEGKIFADGPKEKVLALIKQLSERKQEQPKPEQPPV